MLTDNLNLRVNEQCIHKVFVNWCRRGGKSLPMKCWAQAGPILLHYRTLFVMCWSFRRTVCRKRVHILFIGSSICMCLLKNSSAVIRSSICMCWIGCIQKRMCIRRFNASLAVWESVWLFESFLCGVVKYRRKRSMNEPANAMSVAAGLLTQLAAPIAVVDKFIFILPILMQFTLYALMLDDYFLS